MTKQQILKAAMKLDLDDRIDVADELMATVIPKERREIDKAWAAQAQRRLDAINRGQANVIPGPQVFKQIRTKFAK